MKYLFNPKEQEVIESMIISGFAAHLQCVFMDKANLKRLFEKNKLPSNKNLKEIIQNMKEWNFNFDEKYNFTLPRQSTNPLKQEEAMWRRLAPRIETFLKATNRWIERYDNANPEYLEPTKRVIGVWLDIHQEWNSLSNSYRQKLEEVYQSRKTN